MDHQLLQSVLLLTRQLTAVPSGLSRGTAGNVCALLSHNFDAIVDEREGSPAVHELPAVHHLAGVLVGWAAVVRLPSIDLAHTFQILFDAATDGSPCEAYVDALAATMGETWAPIMERVKESFTITRSMQ